MSGQLGRRWCARPSCRHAPSRHALGRCPCGCPAWAERWPHWWRRLVTETLSAAEAVWQAQAEAAGVGYETETAEWVRDHPRPTLKQTLQDLATGEGL